MATTSSVPGSSEDIARTLCTSLLFLGIDRMRMEHTLRTPMNEKMFMNMNKQAGGYVLHFLLTCIDRERALTSFKYTWPVLEKKQEAQFLKISFEWYKEIHSKFELKPPVVTRASVTPGSPKFYGTLRVLIPVAVTCQMKTYAPDQVVLRFQSSNSKTEQAATVKLLRAWKNHHYQRYCQQQLSRAHNLQLLRAKARELKTNYRELQQKKKQKIEEIKKTCVDNTVILRPMDKLIQDFQNCSKEKSEKVLEAWKKTKKFSDTEENLWEIVAPLFDRNRDSPPLSSNSLKPSVPGAVAKEHAHTILQKGLGSLYVNNNLDLLMLTSYSALAMKSILQYVKKSHACTKPVCSQALESQQNRVQSLSTNMIDMEIRMRDLLVNLSESVANQRATLMKSLGTSGNSSSQLDLSQGVSQICPPTPPIRLVATPGSVAKVHVQPPLSLFTDVQDLRKDMMSWRARLHDTPSVNTSVQKLSKTHRMSFPTSVEDSKAVSDPDQDGLTSEYLTLDSRVRYRTVAESNNQDRSRVSMHPKAKGKQEKKAHRKSVLPTLPSVQSLQTGIVSDKERQTTDLYGGVKVTNSSKSEMTLHKAEETVKTDAIKESGKAEQCDLVLDKLAKLLAEDGSTVLGDMSINASFSDSLATPVSYLEKNLKPGNDTTVAGEDDSNDETLKFADSGLGTNTPGSLLEVIEKINVTPKQSPWCIKKRRMLSSLPSSSKRKSLVYARSQSPPSQDKLKTLDLETSFGTPKVVNVTPVKEIGKGVLGGVGKDCELTQSIGFSTQSNFNTLIEEYKQWKSECPEDIAKRSNTKFKKYIENVKKNKVSNGKGPKQATDYSSLEHQMQGMEALLTDIEVPKVLAPKSAVKTTAQSTEDDEDEKFLDSGLVDKYLSQPLYKSSLLPADSFFDTLTDSILGGETDTKELLLEDVQEEVRRESILMRRQSLMENKRISLSSNSRLSDMFITYRLSGFGNDQDLFETSDSCLLSTSFDDM